MNPGEKELMKLWNRHVSTYSVIPDKLLSRCCLEFASKWGSEVLRLGLRNNFALHLMNLFNLNLITHLTVRSSLGVIKRLQNPDAAQQPVLMDLVE